MDVEKLLQQVKDGKVSIREAAQDLKDRKSTRLNSSHQQ